MQLIHKALRSSLLLINLKGRKVTFFSSLLSIWWGLMNENGCFRKRLSADECLQHSWMTQCDMSMSCVKLSTDKLKKFIIRRKWQVRTIHNYTIFCNIINILLNVDCTNLRKTFVVPQLYQLSQIMSVYKHRLYYTCILPM